MPRCRPVALAAPPEENGPLVRPGTPLRLRTRCLAPAGDMVRPLRICAGPPASGGMAGLQRTQGMRGQRRLIPMPRSGWRWRYV